MQHLTSGQYLENIGVERNCDNIGLKIPGEKKVCILFFFQGGVLAEAVGGEMLGVGS